MMVRGTKIISTNNLNIADIQKRHKTENGIFLFIDARLIFDFNNISKDVPIVPEVSISKGMKPYPAAGARTLYLLRLFLYLSPSLAARRGRLDFSNDS